MKKYLIIGAIVATFFGVYTVYKRYVKKTKVKPQTEPTV